MQIGARSSTYGINISKERSQDFHQIKQWVEQKLKKNARELSCGKQLALPIKDKEFRGMLVDHYTGRGFKVLQTQNGISFVSAPEEFLSITLAKRS